MLVQTDAANSLDETNEANNVTASASITVTIAPTPDLQCTDVMADADITQPQQTLTVSWTVTNAGESQARATWSDRIYTFDRRDTQRCQAAGNDPAQRQLVRAAVVYGLGRNRSAHPPDGNYEILVVTDIFDEVYEANDESNNQQIATQRLNVVHADLHRDHIAI